MKGNVFSPGPTPNTVRAGDGRILNVSEGWVLLPPGDTALTRQVKEAGEFWVVQEKKGRKVFSRGVWAPAATIARIRADLEAERSTEGFAKHKEADARLRDKAQVEYVEGFSGAVITVFAFHSVPRLGSQLNLSERHRPISRFDPHNRCSQPRLTPFACPESLRRPPCAVHLTPKGECAMAKPLGPKSLLIRDAIKAHPHMGNTELAELINGSDARGEDRIEVKASDVAQQKQALKKAGETAPAAAGNGGGKKPARKPSAAAAAVSPAKKPAAAAASGNSTGGVAGHVEAINKAVEELGAEQVRKLTGLFE